MIWRCFNVAVLLFLIIGTGYVSALELQFEVDPLDQNALPSAISKVIDTAFEFNQRGLNALEKKQYDKALEFFDKALSVFPDYSDALNNKGVVYFRKGIISDAQKIWEDLAVKDPTYAIASYNLGLIYQHERQLESAKRLFERALKIDNKLVEAYVRLGMITMQIGSKEKGLEYLKKAYKINPSNTDVWSFLAYGLILTGDTSGAVNILLKKEDHAQALRILGSIENIRRNYAKAENYFAKAVAKGAEPSLLVDLASTQLDNGKCAEASGVLKKYFDIDIPHSADSWLLAGIASKDCGDVTSAQKYFEEGVRRFPKDPILKYNLGQIYFHNKLFDKADQIWNGLSDSLQDPSLLYLRAFNAKKRNKLQEAKVLIEKALSMDDRAEFHDFLGVIYHLNKDDTRAEEQFRKALKINPELRSAQLNLALTSKKAEDTQGLIMELTIQLSTCPKDTFADISFQLALLYYHQKEIEKAIKVLTDIKTEDRDDRIYRHLAIFYREIHDFNKAISVLEEAATRLVLEPQMEYEIAETYLLAGYYAKAAEKLTSLIPKWKQNPWRLHYQLGYAYMEINEMEKAKQCFEKSLKS
ncbi:MAG: tetratricopeptide repeat protein, partial [Fibrobacter sp.]|nr:tetratricopeptide repeat protein [Fibrobacter sp.]